jgi:hypothetical protein
MASEAQVSWEKGLDEKRYNETYFCRSTTRLTVSGGSFFCAAKNETIHPKRTMKYLILVFCLQDVVSQKF